MKQKIKRMIPVILVICITMAMSLNLYNTIMKKEEEKCCSTLEESANTVSKQMRNAFLDDIHILYLITSTINTN